MELGNWPIEVQLGSTNSKGLPVLFQGSHQGLFLNDCHCTVLCSEPWLLPTPGSLQPPTIQSSHTRDAIRAIRVQVVVLQHVISV